MNESSIALHLVEVIRANVNNDKLTDAQFREFVKNSLPERKESFDPLENIGAALRFMGNRS